MKMDVSLLGPTGRKVAFNTTSNILEVEFEVQYRFNIYMSYETLESICSSFGHSEQSTGHKLIW